MKNILLTGATGFLGSNILSLLIENDYFPIVFIRENSNTWRIQHLKQKYKCCISSGDINNDIKKIFQENHIEAIIHTATEYGRNVNLSNIFETNILLPLKLIETGIRNNLRLFINSDTFFGKKEFDLKYLNNYITSKRMLEAFLIDLSSVLCIVNLRIEHMYGENDSESKFVTSIIKQAILNKQEILLTKGTQKRDFVYVQDVANAYLSILKNKGLVNGFNEYEVGSGSSISIKEFINKIAQITETTSNFNFGALPVRDGEIEDSFAKTSPLCKLGWNPKFGIDEALKKIISNEKNRYSNEF